MGLRQACIGVGRGLGKNAETQALYMNICLFLPFTGSSSKDSDTWARVKEPPMDLGYYD